MTYGHVYPSRLRSVAYSADKIALIRADLRAGMTVRELAEKYYGHCKFPISSLLNFCNRNQIPLPKRGHGQYLVPAARSASLMTAKEIAAAEMAGRKFRRKPKLPFPE
jgi:hypothetical protein